MGLDFRQRRTTRKAAGGNDGNGVGNDKLGQRGAILEARFADYGERRGAFDFAQSGAAAERAGGEFGRVVAKRDDLQRRVAGEAVFTDDGDEHRPSPFLNECRMDDVSCF